MPYNDHTPIPGRIKTYLEYDSPHVSVQINVLLPQLLQHVNIPLCHNVLCRHHESLLCVQLLPMRFRSHGGHDGAKGEPNMNSNQRLQQAPISMWMATDAFQLQVTKICSRTHLQVYHTEVQDNS